MKKKKKKTTFRFENKTFIFGANMNFGIFFLSQHSSSVCILRANILFPGNTKS